MFKFLLLLCACACFAVSSNSVFSLGNIDSSITKIMESILNRNYDAATSEVSKIEEQNKDVACILKGMIFIGQYDDLGDTSAIINATKLLNKCKSKDYWEALRVFELGYTQSEQGHSLKGAIHTKSAAEIFAKSNDADAKSFYAIYAYYMNNSLKWLPFVSDKSESHLNALECGAKQSKWFWPLFTTSLIWMHYDRKEYNKGLELANNALAKAPNHPVFLQIKADMLYRLKKYEESSSIYEKSAKDYLKRTGKSLRYWCAAANLIRIYHDAKNEELKNKWKKEIQSAEFEKIKDWMPGSLMNDLKERNLLD